MNRRKFLKAGLIWVPAFPAIVHAQSEDWFRVASEGALAASGGSCPADGSAQIAVTGAVAITSLGSDANHIYIAQMWNDGGTPRTVCKLGFLIGANSGNLALHTYTAYILATSGTNLVPGTIKAQSNGVTGSNSWGLGGTFVRFPMITPFTTSASVVYGLAVSAGGTPDATNCAEAFAQSVSQIAGYWDCFNAAGTAQCNAGGTADLGIEIYYQ